MKPAILILILCTPLLSTGQITFEELASPDDFNISAVRKSQIGEYFVQASNDDRTMYTSMDGLEWTKLSLPIDHHMDDIQFFSDGTPLLKQGREGHLVRRNGAWYAMNLTGFSQEIKASFIRNDTLFVFHDKILAFSIDKGQTFNTIFTITENILDQTIHLWKFEKEFVLYYTNGNARRLAVYNEDGALSLLKIININSPFFGYSNCGDVLIYDQNKYYLLKQQGLSFEEGSIEDILPDVSFYKQKLVSQDSNFYFRTGSSIFKTEGCNFTWDTLVSNLVILANENIWISDQDDIFLNNEKKDFFIEQTNGANSWQEHFPDINYSFIELVAESVEENQMALSSNALFQKKINDSNWTERVPGVNRVKEILYSPDGGLYLKRDHDILYSTDNGNNFSTIILPDISFEYSMDILDDDVLFVQDGGFGDSYYTINNGKDWILADLFSSADISEVKLIDNYIIVADLSWDFIVTKIDIETNESTEEYLGDFNQFNYFGGILLDDGTIYFNGEDFNSTNPEGLYRYVFGGPLEFLGPFHELAWLPLSTSGNKLFAFSQDEYYFLENDMILSYSYEGLPSYGNKEFFIADNEHLYTLIDNHRIFRSKLPLSFTIATKEPSAFIEFNVFPNPANAWLTLTFSDADLQRIDSYDIIDQLGRVVTQSGYLNNKRILVSHLTPGVFNLVLKKNGVIVGMRKFVRL